MLSALKTRGQRKTSNPYIIIYNKGIKMSNQEVRYLIKNELQYLVYIQPIKKNTKIIVKKYKDIIANYCYDGMKKLPYNEKLYIYLNQIKEIQICQYCKVNRVLYINQTKGYALFCSRTCSSNGSLYKRQQTCLDKYGASNPMKSDEIKNKFTRMINEKYKNVDYKTKIVNKRKETHVLKYGVENPLQRDLIKEKIKSTNLKKYGTTNPAQSQVIKDKMKATNFLRYGCYNAMQNKDIFEKAMHTYLLRTGISHPSKQPNYRKNCSQTYFNRTGYHHNMQNPESFHKQQESAFKYKEYQLPSGKIVKVQGYEPFALNILLNEQNYKEDELIISTIEQPQIKYFFENEQHKHYLDIFIPKENRIIEIKSTYTYEREIDKCLAKQNAAKEQGYIYEIWIIDKEKIIEVIS